MSGERSQRGIDKELEKFEIVQSALGLKNAKPQKQSELAEFLHGCCGCPVKSTFITAIQNKHFVTWPGLTSDLIRKHLAPSQITSKGHMNQEKQGLQAGDPP